jgi:CheY-like chemotaxis protein
MKILVLDNEKARLKLFKQKLIGNVVDCAKTAAEAIELLKNNDYDLVSLDHDLTGQVFQPSGPGTGFEVAQWLVEHIDRKPKRIIIHSFNIAGAQNILAILPEAEYIPGSWLLNKIF